MQPPAGLNHDHWIERPVFKPDPMRQEQSLLHLALLSMKRLDLTKSESLFPAFKDPSFLNTEINICPSYYLFVCVEVLQPSQPNRVMSSAVSLPNHTFTGQA